MDQLPDFLGGTSNFDYRSFPNGCKSISEFDLEEYGITQKAVEKYLEMFENLKNVGIENNNVNHSEIEHGMKGVVIGNGAKGFWRRNNNS